ncbi:ABC transporter ATP-binding protein [Clostridium oceanicum]|uniref:Dipeptide ABC transporter ATP-binding protein n=1 Tax=Clostridium oceanicum TaxID=1543 RepID=A0ABN1J9K3_9CLOT
MDNLNNLYEKNQFNIKNKVDNLLEVKDLKKYFKTREKFNLKRYFKYGKKSLLDSKAVDGVSFNIKEGQILGLVGESGCGKSTTGKSILRLIEPTFGSVRFNGKTLFDVENKIYMDKNELTYLRKDIQFIFQNPYASLNPRMKIERIVSEGIKKHNIVSKFEIKDKCQEILSLCGLSKADLSKFPNEFSGGQRQRIVIARALAVNPKFVVCDEPTAALDVSIQSQILNLMLDLKDKFQLTYLFISHNLEVVRYVCDSICVMYLGKIVEKSKTQNLYSNPLHPYSRALISCIPKNHPSDKEEKIILKGSVPSSSNIPCGCRFNTRCPYKDKYCEIVEPELKEILPGHFVACHKA